MRTCWPCGGKRTEAAAAAPARETAPRRARCNGAMGAGEEETVELAVQEDAGGRSKKKRVRFRQQLMQLRCGVHFFPAGEGNAPAWSRAYSKGGDKAAEFTEAACRVNHFRLLRPSPGESHQLLRRTARSGRARHHSRLFSEWTSHG